MAVIDQDNFSNISWHSEQGGGASSSSVPPGQTSAEEIVHNLGQHDPIEEAYNEMDAGGAAGPETLECKVSAPLLESEGTREQFISYLVTTNVRLELPIYSL